MNNVGQDNQVSAGSLIAVRHRSSERLHRSYLVTAWPCYTARPMFDVILYQPEIPPNTGNIIRLCANTGAMLHLVKPLGFSLDDKQLVRAGLDYHEFATMTVHESWAECAACMKDRRLFAVSTKGTQRYDLIEYEKGDAFVFGPESRGLPSEILGAVAEQHRIRVPMVPGNRSLNLSNSVAVVIYEAWRQNGFGKRA